MKIICGPDFDQREVKIELPTEKTKIGVFVSGGLDSAILYYMVLKANEEIGDLHDVVPFMIARTEGSKYLSNPIVTHVQQQFRSVPHMLKIVGDPTLPGNFQVRSGGFSAYLMGCTQIYIGVIKQLPEHTAGEEPVDLNTIDPHIKNSVLKLPLENLMKYHIVDLIRKFNQDPIFYLSHSCSIKELGRCKKCNGCNERSWGFQQLGISDPGTI
jgi:hypothetical protein